jgi:hypothetical protein
MTFDARARMADSLQRMFPERRGEAHFSPIYLAWCAKHCLKPDVVAGSLLEDFALENPKGVIVESDDPETALEVYDIREEEP